MKTKLWSVFFVQLMLVLSVVSFNSCSDDDDESYSSSIVGLWACEEIEGYSIQFNANRTGVEILTVNSTTFQGGFEYQYDSEQGIVSIVGSDGNLYLEDASYQVIIGTTTMNLGGLKFKRK